MLDIIPSEVLFHILEYVSDESAANLLEVPSKRIREAVFEKKNILKKMKGYVRQDPLIGMKLKNKNIDIFLIKSPNQLTERDVKVITDIFRDISTKGSNRFMQKFKSKEEKTSEDDEIDGLVFVRT